MAEDDDIIECCVIMNALAEGAVKAVVNIAIRLCAVELANETCEVAVRFLSFDSLRQKQVGAIEINHNVKVAWTGDRQNDK